MSKGLSRRDFIVASAALLSPVAGLAGVDLLSAEQVEKMIADDFWRRFTGGEYERGGETMRPVDDATFNRAVEDIAGPLFARSTRSTLDWRIGTVDTSVVNAFTPGGGVVCLLRGIVRYCDSEVELASVIAHEIGHVEHRHAIERMMAHRLFKTINHDLIAARSQGIDQSINSNRFDQVAPEIIYAAYERLKEHEADAFAVRALAQAGYDVSVSHRLFEKFLSMESGSVPLRSCLMASHPATKERIARMKGLSKRYGKQRPRPDSDAFRYLKSVA